MSEYRQRIAARFACILNHALIKRFGKTPSAATLAMHFNLKTSGIDPISQETARRWMRGLSLPELPRFQVLSDWLKISQEDFLNEDVGIQRQRAPLPAALAPNLSSITRLELDVMKFTDPQDLEQAMVAMMRNLKLRDQQAMILTALALTEKQRVAH